MSKSFHPARYLAVPRSPFAETIRSLRTEVIQLYRRGKSKLLCTSCWAGEGKSTVCLNLAQALSEFGLRVLIVDGDLRGSTLSRVLLGPNPRPGLQVSDWTPSIFIRPAGVVDQDASPASVLTSPAYIEQFSTDCRSCDLCLVDTPALSMCSDALLFQPCVDGCLLITSKRRFQGIPEGNLREDIRDVGMELLGVVVTP